MKSAAMMRHREDNVRAKSVTLEDCFSGRGIHRVLMRGNNLRIRNHKDATSYDERRSSVIASRRVIERIVLTVMKNVVAMKRHGKSKTVRATDVKAAFYAAYKLRIVGGEMPKAEMPKAEMPKAET